MKKVKAKGTFCLRCWAVFCGWLNSITKHYAIINNEFHSSFTEKCMNNWNVYSTQSIQQLIESTNEQRKKAQALICRKAQIDAMECVDEESIEAKRRNLEVMLIYNNLQTIQTDLLLQLLCTKEKLIEAAGKYQRNLVGFYSGLHKRFPNNNSRVECVLLTKEVETNQALTLYQDELACYDKAISDILN